MPRFTSKELLYYDVYCMLREVLNCDCQAIVIMANVVLVPAIFVIKVVLQAFTLICQVLSMLLYYLPCMLEVPIYNSEAKICQVLNNCQDQERPATRDSRTTFEGCCQRKRTALPSADCYCKFTKLSSHAKI